MELHQAVRILIVTNEDAVEALYYSILEHYQLDTSNFEEAAHKIVRFVPHVVLLHFDYSFQADILKFLNQLRQNYDNDQRPLVLLIVPKDWFDQRVEVLVDEYLAFPVAPSYLLESLKNLLDKKME
jgi:DNA-binding response OmpR family regulator